MKRSPTTGFCQIKHGKNIMKEMTMGRVSDWLIEMEEDAFCMTRDEWTAKHGESCIDIYNKLRAEWLDESVIPNEPQEHGKSDDAKDKSTDTKDYSVY